MSLSIISVVVRQLRKKDLSCDHHNSIGLNQESMGINKNFRLAASIIGAIDGL